VADVGGLFILGTERHESRRIDRQLRGRAGRQGDPGASRFYLSLEDDLMRLFGSERISALMQRMGVQEGEVIEHGMVTSAISRAQKRVEAHNFDIRKHLLEYDNVMNKQREEVYRQRNEALTSEDISARVIEDIEDLMADRVEVALGDGRVHPEEWNLRGLADEMSLMLMTIVDENSLRTPNVEELRERAAGIAEKAYRAREHEFTPEVTRELEKHLYLFTIDEKWREHLHELDHLKGGIGLRAYGQRDPLVEYKKEAFGLFESMMNEVREELVKRFFRVQLAPQAAQQVIAEQPHAPRHMVAQHAEAEAFSGAPSGNGEAVAGGPAPAPAQQTLRAVDPQRQRPEVGRNDPCWCGSGKKYKKCHQPIDEGTEVS
ncbi:MAG: SEC-C metal-binding domain-containing protein, partial [Candidatus Eisenbacteria bacterium]